MIGLRELCTRFSGVVIQNISRSTEQGSQLLNPSNITVWAIARGSTQTPLALRKQSRTPFIIFSGEKRDEVKKANPGIAIPQLGRILGQMWRSLSVENKEVYQRRYQDEKEIFIAKRNAELDSMTEEEKAQLNQLKIEQKNKRQIRKERKLKKELLKPRPTDVNPFVLFFKSKAGERGDTPVSVHLKRQSENWKSMSDAQRKPFEEQAKANSIRYQDEMKRWEAKMFAQGNTNVLSPGVIGKLQKASRPRTRKSATVKPRKPRVSAKAAAASSPSTTSPGKISASSPSKLSPIKPTPMKPKVK